MHKNVAATTELPEANDDVSDNSTFNWAGKPGQLFSEELNTAYEKNCFL